MRGGRRSALTGAVLLLEVVVAACGRPGAGAEKTDATGTSPKPAPTPASASASARFDEETELADGRHVGVSYAPGRGLLERHQDAETGAWSEPHVVYRTTSDPCQSLTLKAFDGTVAVIANWGYYCADGEPPTETIAAVGTGNLSRWDTKLTRNFDGWSKVTAVDDSRQLRFTSGSLEWLTRLRWSRAEGFAEVEDIRR